MKPAPHLPSVVLAGVAGLLIAAAWSARAGRRVWAPRTFAWRNFLGRPAEVERQPGAPLLVRRQRFYSFFPGGPPFGSVLAFDTENASDRAVHSFAVSYRAAPPFHGGAFGCQPAAGLAPGESLTSKISARGKEIASLSIDFVQFADGGVWYAEPPRETVRPEGVRAGERAAAEHLLGVYESGGADAVLGALPRIHADVFEPPPARAREAWGSFGHYCGVTRVGVCVRHAFGGGGPRDMELTLRRLAGA